jgi:hypothetical protein
VSGTVALLLKAYPGMTNSNIRQILQRTSVDIGQQGRDIFFGYGRIDTKAAIDQVIPPQKKYRCTGTPNYQCVEDPNGPYNSLAECQTVCKPAPQTKMFKVHIIDQASAKPIGILITKNLSGDYTADDTCKIVCNTLKIMEK